MIKYTGITSSFYSTCLRHTGQKITPHSIRYVRPESPVAVVKPSEDNYLLRLYKTITGLFAKDSESAKPPEIKIRYNDIKYGKKHIGYVEYDIRPHAYGKTGDFPENWFVDGIPALDDGRRMVKPYMWIDLLYMDDRRMAKSFVPRDKKYGAMVMKKLLEIANKCGCEDRIALKAAVLPLSSFSPGGFYHKMGFSPTPDEIKIIKKIENSYLSAQAKLVENGCAQEETAVILAKEGYILPQIQDGRYKIFAGKMVLTNPECIINYPA